MSKTKQRQPFRKSINLSDVTIDGDLVLRGTVIVRESQKGIDGVPEFFSVEHLLVYAFKKVIGEIEPVLGKIEITTSGLAAYIVPVAEGRTIVDSSTPLTDAVTL